MKKKMTISILTQYFYPEHFLISELAAELHRRGHDVSVMTGLPNYPQGQFFKGYSLFKGPFQETYQGVRVHRTPIIPRGKGFLQLALNYLSFIFSASCSLWRLPKADVYFVFGISPLMSAIPAILYRYATRRPVVIWLQDLWPESLSAVGVFPRTHFIYKFIELIVRWIYQNTDFILIQSPRFMDNLKAYGFAVENSLFTPNWGEHFPTTSSEPNWLKELPHNKFIVTFAGNIGIAQSVDTIFNAAILLQSHPEINFVFVGDGRELSRLVQKKAELGLNNIFFLGRKPFSDMGALFAKSSALLVTLKKEDIFQKTIPSKVIQYFTAKKPIISAAGGITNELILQNNAGVIAEPEDEKSLAEAVLSLASRTRSEQEQMGQNAYAYYEKEFTKIIVLDRIEKTLQKFCK